MSIGVKAFIRSMRSSVGQALLLAIVMIGLSATTAAAVPAFAEQTGRNCQACHAGGFGPQLTPYGREFKMGGYTDRSVSFNVPISVMAVASYLNTAKGQSPPPADHFSSNNNVAMDQLSLFLAGSLGSHLGGFVQTTYDGVSRKLHWDNLDLRAVNTATVGKVDVVMGLSLNNAPTVADAFNTLPSWGFPYTTSALAPATGAAPLIGSLAQNSLGVTGYLWINSEVYLEVGGYRSLSRDFLNRVNIDPFSPGSIKGLAPYGRLAYQKNFGDWNAEVGIFALRADVYPGRDTSQARADRYTDFGLDGSFQYFAANKDVFTVNGRFTDERQRLDASQPLGLTNNARNSLRDARVDASYYLRNKIGFTVGAFDTTGSPDAGLYASNRTLKPSTQGLNFQVDHTLNGDGVIFGPRFNLRVGAQYIAYYRFDGARRNYDGTGHNAGDNNSIRLFVWAAY